MYVHEIVEKMKVSSDLKRRIEEIIEVDDTYSLELQAYLQSIYKAEKEAIELLLQKPGQLAAHDRCELDARAAVEHRAEGTGLAGVRRGHVAGSRREHVPALPRCGVC